jgi:Family of unknown function (DUF6152)
MSTQRILVVRTVGLSALAALTLGALAHAHHSFAMFDNTKTLSVSGTVRDLEWANPHVWLWIDVAGADGKVVSYGFEGAAPGEMSRNSGWTKRSLVTGDKVTVSYRPLLRDISPGAAPSKP